MAGISLPIPPVVRTVMSSQGDGEVTLEVAVVPPLEAGTPRIDLVAARLSAQVQATLPLRWTWNP